MFAGFQVWYARMRMVSSSEQTQSYRARFRCIDAFMGGMMSPNMMTEYLNLSVSVYGKKIKQAVLYHDDTSVRERSAASRVRA